MAVRSACHTRHGWTLIELCVALAVAAIAATLAWPSLEQLYERLLLRSAAVSLMQNLRVARHQALVEGRSYSARFDAVLNRYVIEGGGRALRSGALGPRLRFGAAPTVLGPPSRPAAPVPADGVTFSGGQVTFRADGSLSPGPGTIYLSVRRGADRYGTATAISLNMAGRLRQYRWERGTWVPI